MCRLSGVTYVLNSDTVSRSTLPAPIWSRTIGRPALVDAWISTDELEDQSNLAAVFAYERQPPHVFVTMVDANFGGLIRKAFVGSNPDKVREWARVSGMSSGLSEQELADRLAQGISLCDSLDPPVDDEARPQCHCASPLAAAPAPRRVETPATSEEVRAQAGRAVRGFARGFRPRGRGEDPRRELARWFIDFACDYGAGDPLRWSPIAIEILMADWLRKAILEGDAIVVPDVLRTFVRFSARHKEGLREDVFIETAGGVDQFAGVRRRRADEAGLGRRRSRWVSRPRASISPTRRLSRTGSIAATGSCPRADGGRPRQASSGRSSRALVRPGTSRSLRGGA
jgi:hypothetical protein